MPIRSQWLSVLISVVLSVLVTITVYAEDLTWSGSGDGTSWSDEDNWYPEATPIISDDLTIDLDDASVECTETFRAKSITVGGRESSTLTINNFVYGTVEPDSTSDIAVSNRRNGKIVFKGGAGLLTVKGRYIDSEESLTPEPSFMFWLE